MSSDTPHRDSPLLHAIGDKDPGTYGRRRALTGAAMVVILGLLATGAVLV